MDNIDLIKKFVLALNINLEDYKIKILDEFIRNSDRKNNHYSDRFSDINHQCGTYVKMITFDDLKGENMNINPICSSCGRDIDVDENLRSVVLLGVSKCSEFVVCENCFLRLSSMFKDCSENQKLKRIKNGQIFLNNNIFDDRYPSKIKDFLEQK